MEVSENKEDKNSKYLKKVFLRVISNFTASKWYADDRWHKHHANELHSLSAKQKLGLYK